MLPVMRPRKSNYVPDRGDVVWLQVRQVSRPAVVLSPRSYNERAHLAVMVPITNRSKGYPFEVPLPIELLVGGVILADQLKSVDWRARKARLIGKLPESVVKAVLQRAAALLSGG